MELDLSEDLRRQVLEGLKTKGVSQLEVARKRGVSRQTVNEVLTGKRPVINETLEATLELMGGRLEVVEVEADAEELYKRAFSYGYRLFPKADLSLHTAFAAGVVWLCMGENPRDCWTVRFLAIRDRSGGSRMSFEWAVTLAMPLAYGPLGEEHKKVIDQNPQRDDRWDAQQVKIWKAEQGKL